MRTAINRRALLGGITSSLTLSALDTRAWAAGLLRSPVGANVEGNANGSIPPWTGGMRSPPPGWQPGQAYVDPFSDEKPLAIVGASNLTEIRDKVSPGLQAVLARNPAFRMPVYRSHRTAAHREGLRKPVPYPEPRNGLEAISNHLLRDLGGGVERTFDSFVMRPSGEPWKIGFHDRRIYDENFDQPMAGRLFSYLGWFVSPADLVGTVYLVHEAHPMGTEERRAWVYNAGQRRVRRAPDLAYDNQQNGSDGMAIVDQYDGYNGRPDLYDWQILGQRELLVPYNNYRIGDKRIPYSQIVQRGSPNPEFLRFELHRVWVVEAKLKPGLTHLYPRRVFYLDEDSWSVLLSEAFDSRGQLWRVGLHSLVQFYDAVVPWYRFELWFDLSNDSYVLTGLDNEYKSRWNFGQRGRAIDFSPDALRRIGR